MRRFGLVALLGIVAMSCGALPVQAKTIALAYKTGDTYRYAFRSTTKQTVDAGGVTIPTDVAITATESVKVTSVDSAGDAGLAITLGGFTVKSTANGVTNTTTGLPDTTMEVKVAPDGRILSVDGTQYTASNPFLAFTGMGGGFFVTAVLPSTAVKPGDTWSKDYSQANPAGTGGFQITSHSKYLRDESVNGISAAVVETNSTGTIKVGIDPSKLAAGEPTALPGGSPSVRFRRAPQLVRSRRSKSRPSTSLRGPGFTLRRTARGCPPPTSPYRRRASRSPTTCRP